MFKCTSYLLSLLFLLGAANAGDDVTNPSVTPPDLNNHKNYHELPAECGVVRPQNRIYGGQAAKLYEFPWMALIAYERDNKIRFNCAGSVINKRYILTAGNCIKNIPTNLQIKYVRLGEYNITSDTDCITTTEGVSECAPPVQDITVEKLIPHPNFLNRQNNIGLIRLSSDIQFNEAVSPVCLPVASTYINSPLTVAGWGRTETGSTSDILLKVQVPLVPEKSCETYYKHLNVPIGDGELCAGEEGKDSCSGDSGTPLLSLNTFANNSEVKFVEIGLVNFGPRVCATTIPSVYTNVAKQMNWILDNLEL